jgi:hypothetical protein
MNRYAERESYVHAGDWVVDTLRRKPEALLLLAAGCALLMRNGRRSHAERSDLGDAYQHGGGRWAGPYGSRFAETGGHAEAGASSTMHQASQLGTQAQQYATDMRNRATEAATGAMASVSEFKDRVADTASSYASSLADYADSTRRTLYEGSTRLTSQAQSAFQTASEGVRDQPLMVAALGLAAGAAVAAIFPATELERRTVGEARDALADAATRARDNLVGAVGEAGEKIKAGVAERGLDTESVKELARDVAETFATAAVGKTEDKGGSKPAPKQQPRGGTDDQSRA